MKRGIYSEKGMALIITLLITAILVAVITEVVYTVHTNAMMMESFKDGERAAMLAEGGVRLATMGINEMMRGKTYTAFGPDEAKQVVPEGEGVLTLAIEDEEGKFPVNSIVFANGETNSDKYAAYSRLLDGQGLSVELADTLADWIDVNDEPRAKGAETYDYYRKLTPPYAAKNAPLDSLGEMMAVKGYTPQVYGKLSRFVTVYSDKLININTAPKEVLMSLSGDITEAMADKVIDYRNKSPFRNTADIRKVSGFETIGFSLQDKISVRSGVFRIFSRATVGTGIKDVEAVVDTQNNGKVLYWRER